MKTTGTQPSPLWGRVADPTVVGEPGEEVLQDFPGRKGEGVYREAITLTPPELRPTDRRPATGPSKMNRLPGFPRLHCVLGGAAFHPAVATER